jgi:hypothetical protein
MGYVKDPNLTILVVLLWRAVNGIASKEKWPVNGDKAAYAIRLAILASAKGKMPVISAASLEDFFKELKNERTALSPEFDKFVEYLCRFTFLHNSTRKIPWLASDWKTQHITDVCQQWEQGYIRRGILELGEDAWNGLDPKTQAELDSVVQYVPACLAAVRVSQR